MTAVRSFFKKFRSVVEDENAFWDAIEAMCETIVHEYEMNEFDQYSQLMCIRGLFILMLNEHFADYMGQAVSEKILSFVIEVLGDAYCDETRELEDLDEHPPVIQFLSTLPTKLLHEYVMQLQNILTVNIIQGFQVNYQLFTGTIQVLDILQWLNVTFKDQKD